MKTIIVTLSFLVFVGTIQAEEYFDAGSLGKKLWSPTTNEVSNALLRVSHYCRHSLSDKKRASEMSEVEVIINDDVVSTEASQRSSTSKKSSVQQVIPELFSISGVPYSKYRKEVRAFFQPYGEKIFKFIAVQHIPDEVIELTKQSAWGSSKPFTVYFNVTNDRLGLALGFPAILYSPGPPFSFHKKVIAKRNTPTPAPATNNQQRKEAE